MRTISKHDTENGTLNKPPMFTPDDYDTWKMAIPNSIIHAFKKCKSDKELWNSLQQMYEGSDDVKKNKKDMLKQKFENFCQENNKKMASQYLRYVQLVDELVVARVKIENQDVIKGEDLDGILADELEEMDINYQMDMISYRAKKFYERTGRQFRKHNMKTRLALDKSKVKCFNCQQLGHFAREYKSPSSQPSTSGQPNHKESSSSNSANIAKHHYFSDWSFQAKNASISNNALMANDSTSLFKVTDDMCTPKCLEKLNSYKRFNAQVCNELESIQDLKTIFFEAERNYKEKIKEQEKTISSLKHQDTNKKCQINNLLERLTTAKTELVLAEANKDKFLSQGEKFEKLLKMTEIPELVNK
ncbi:hypothetical protein E3N88_00474 [Mikania micrantha]|uniref:CCHC-type domain-containing protein n=1 Tax=Mikania micrantha TaxID=192012 RepID=A0A5N6Q0C5_9ASTR|nr:hypothetical protein E3N88_00474 [Mikania micrantha]